MLLNGTITAISWATQLMLFRMRAQSTTFPRKIYVPALANQCRLRIETSKIRIWNCDDSCRSIRMAVMLVYFDDRMQSSTNHRWMRVNCNSNSNTSSSRSSSNNNNYWHQIWTLAIGHWLKRSADHAPSTQITGNCIRWIARSLIIIGRLLVIFFHYFYRTECHEVILGTRFVEKLAKYAIKFIGRTTKSMAATANHK